MCVDASEIASAIILKRFNSFRFYSDRRDNDRKNAKRFNPLWIFFDTANRILVDINIYALISTFWFFFIRLMSQEVTISQLLQVFYVNNLNKI